MIRLNHVYKTYQSDRHALKNVSFNVNSGEFIFLTGPSGAGKSTLFRILSAQDSATTGDVSILEFNHRDLNLFNVHQFRRKIGIVFQDFKLINDQTVKQNLLLPLKYAKKDLLSNDDQLNAVLKMVNLSTDVLNEYPLHLSGGEQQKVAVARSFIHKPEVILADEPTGNLDPDSSQVVFSVLESLARQGTTVIVATHDLEYYNSALHRKIHLEKGEIKSDHQPTQRARQ